MFLLYEYIFTRKSAIAMKYLPFFFVDILILSILVISVFLVTEK